MNKTLNEDLIVLERVQEYSATIKNFDTPNFVVTEDNIDAVSDTIKAIKMAIDDIIARRKRITDPLDASKKEAMNQQHAIVGPMEDKMNVLKKKTNIYLIEKIKAQEAEERRLKELELKKLEETKAEQLEQADLNQSELALEDAMKTEEEIENLKKSDIIVKKTGHTSNFSNVHTRKVRKWKLVDIKQVPEEFLIVDEKQINAVVRAGRKEIKGIEIWTENIVVSR